MDRKTRIRALGDGARDYVAEYLPDAVLVDEEEDADFILLPAAEVAELTEDAAAAAAWRRSREEEAVPLAVADRLLAGDNPVRVWRMHRGLSLTALAEAAGVGKGYLSQLERGERQGPVQVLKRLAVALRVDIDDLV